MTLIKTNTSTGAASSSFTADIDNTYKLYIFKFYDVNPATDDAEFRFNASIDSGSNYNVIKTTTFFDAYHYESGASNDFEYVAANDHAQATTFQTLTRNVGNDADSGAVGTLWLFNPSNTIYVKHFYSRSNHQEPRDWSVDAFTAGYFNNTSAIDAIQFKMSSGDMDSVIKMYGVG